MKARPWGIGINGADVGDPVSASGAREEKV